MSERRTDNKSENGDCRVGVSFTGQNKLTHRATAEKDAAKTCKSHAEQIPQAVRMGDRLIGKTRMEVTEGNIYKKSCNQYSYKAQYQFCFVE